jgi:ABC-type branched-subunit amino acid transport system substrate-binding protein
VRRLAAAAALALVATACASTVDPRHSQTATAPASGALSPASGSTPGAVGRGTATGATTGSDPAGAATSAGSAPATNGGGAPSTGAGASAGGTTAGAADTGPATGRGFDEDTLYIGYLTWKEVSTAGGAVGYAVDYGDQEAIGRAVAKAINDAGGIAGRTVELVFYDYKTSEILSNPQQADQAACSQLTEDRPVFAVVAVTGILTEVLPECLKQHDTPIVANTNVPYLKQAFDDYRRYFYSTASPMTERFLPVWLQAARDAGYFESWDTNAGAPGVAPVKAGILTSDSEAGDIFTQLVTAELESQGVEVASTYALASPFDSNGINSAVLQFRSAGVTHVVPESLNLLLFPQAAESQRYRPRYAISTASAPILIESAAPKEQLAGALGVGYFPSYDVGTAHDPGDPSPAAAHCREIQEAAGQDTDQRESWNLMGKACDGFAFVATAIANGGLSTEGVWQGAQAIQSLPPAGAFAITFAGGRSDGPAAVRDLGFDTACGCFTFISTTNRPL